MGQTRGAAEETLIGWRCAGRGIGCARRRFEGEGEAEEAEAEAEASETVSVSEAFRLRPPAVKTPMGGSDGEDGALR